MTSIKLIISQITSQQINLAFILEINWIILSMDYSFFINQMTGNWVVQSTKYSLLKNQGMIDTFISQVEWIHVSKDNNYFHSVLANLGYQHVSGPPNLYCIGLLNKSSVDNKHNLLLLDSKSKQACILKYNYEFNLTNKFLITHYSRNYISMISNTKNFTIIEKIYFLHDNLKITKSIIKQHQKCIGISFSSEIRIS